MKYRVFATDFDGTIATDGMLDGPTIGALQRLRSAGVICCLVTGRELWDFENAEAVLSLFDYVVAENGAVLYTPGTKDTRVIAPAPPADFLSELTRRGVPIRVGQVIVATVEPHEVAVLEAVKEAALELQVIFNKGAVMVLPAGVNKATGLQAILDLCDMSFADVVGVGDAENDHVFLEHCGLSAAVANAVPGIKERAKLVTRSNAGAGVTELIDALLSENIQSLQPEEN